MPVQLAQRLASTLRSSESTLSLSEFHRLESPGNSERVEPRILARSILPFTRTALAPDLIGLRFEELHRTITLYRQRREALRERNAPEPARAAGDAQKVREQPRQEASHFQRR